MVVWPDEIRLGSALTCGFELRSHYVRMKASLWFRGWMNGWMCRWEDNEEVVILLHISQSVVRTVFRPDISGACLGLVRKLLRVLEIRQGEGIVSMLEYLALMCCMCVEETEQLRLGLFIYALCEATRCTNLL